MCGVGGEAVRVGPMWSASGGSEATERVGFVRHAWERVGMGVGLVWGVFFGEAGGSAGTGDGPAPGESGRLLELRRQERPGREPQRGRPGRPHRRPGRSPCEVGAMTLGAWTLCPLDADRGVPGVIGRPRAGKRRRAVGGSPARRRQDPETARRRPRFSGGTDRGDRAGASGGALPSPKGEEEQGCS